MDKMYKIWLQLVGCGRGLGIMFNVVAVADALDPLDHGVATLPLPSR
jgi:hypothetical protein